MLILLSQTLLFQMYQSGLLTTRTGSWKTSLGKITFPAYSLLLCAVHKGFAVFSAINFVNRKHWLYILYEAKQILRKYLLLRPCSPVNFKIGLFTFCFVQVLRTMHSNLQSLYLLLFFSVVFCVAVLFSKVPIINMALTLIVCISLFVMNSTHVRFRIQNRPKFHQME